MQLNHRAFTIAEDLLLRAEALNAASHVIGGARVLDCGVHAAGCDAAGLGMALASLAGLAEVCQLPPAAAGSAWPDCPWPGVRVTSAVPVAACLAAQYAGWRIASGAVSYTHLTLPTILRV